LFGAIHENSEVLTVYSKLAADLIFVALFEKQGLDQAPILVRKLPHDAANLLLHLVEREDITDTQSWIRNVELVVGADLAA
jgi:hypothetical protein